MKSLANLPEAARHWTTIAIQWADQYWNSKLGLLGSPDDTDREPDAPTGHSVRATIWYVTGLLLRREGNDIDHAIQSIRSILTYQFDEPGMVYHGTFYRSPEEDHPPPEPVEWQDYDPNWREFICTVFIVLLDEFPLLLPDDLKTDMMTAIHKAAEGASTRNVDPGYTNIALMSAFLLDYAGDQFDISAWREQAYTMAQAIHNLFRRTNTFWEYNSPTYYGVDFFALALWRIYGLTREMRKLGAEMEADLWRDVAQFYHAGMKNLCGPYDRSYGMDMTVYLAVLGLSIAAVVPPQHAPLPNPKTVFGHAGDFYFMPPIGLLTPSIPNDALPHFLSFQGERSLEREIEPGRIATAWLSENLMLGAETKHPARIPNYQFHPFTAHWYTPSGSIGWIRLRAETHVSTTVTKNQVTVSGESVEDFYFGIHATHIESQGIQADTWQLPGLTVRIDANGIEPSVVQEGDKLAVRFHHPDGISGHLITLDFAAAHTTLQSNFGI